MEQVKKVSVAFLSIAVLLFIARTSVAQESSDNDFTEKSVSEIDAKILGEDFGTEIKTGVDCDDYYRFGSIVAEIKPEMEKYVAGEEIVFRGKIKNDNDQPVVGGGVYAQILRNNESGVLSNGNHIVDEFFVQEGLSLAPQEERNVEFKWKAPSGLVGGEYTVATFFVVERKYNLSGLSFWNHTYAGFSNFMIEGTKSGIYFDRNDVSVNGKIFELRSMNEPLGNSEPITIKVPLINESGKTSEVKLRYRLYYWDSLQDSNLIEEKEEMVVLSAGATKVVEYIVKNSERSVYYLNLVAESDGTRSIINVRPMTEGSRARINYSGVTKFPVRKGDNLTSFACFHNTSFAATEGRIEQVLKDRKGNVIDKLEYGGQIGGNIGAAKNDILAESDYEYLKLETTAYDGQGNTLEKTTLVYDCSLFEGDYCGKNGAGAEGAGDSKWSSLERIVITVIALSGLLALLLGWAAKKKGRRATASLIFLVAASASTYFMIEADRTLSYVITDRTYGTTVTDMSIFRSSIWTNILYDVNLRQSGANLSDGQALSSGNNINFSFAKSGEWGRKAGGMDTPPIAWDTWAGAGCKNYYFSGGECEMSRWYGFIRCNTPATRRVVKVSGPITCYGTYCTVDGYTTPDNPIVVKTEVSQTNCYSRVYARGNGSNGGGCAQECNYYNGANTSVCRSRTAQPGTGYIGCWDNTCTCNDRAQGTSQCPWSNKCHLMESKTFGNFIPYNAVNWTFYYPAPTLGVALSASPASGPAPLNNVVLTATVSGTASGSTTYDFDCTNDGIIEATQVDNPVYAGCSYASAGSHSPSVNVARAGQSANNSASVLVNSPVTLGVALSASPASGPAPLNNVVLTATVSGTASGSTTYDFDCTNDGIIEATQADDPEYAECSYGSVGSYTASVTATRQGMNASSNTPIEATLTMCDGSCPSNSSGCSGDGLTNAVSPAAWHGVASCSADECECECGSQFNWDAGLVRCICRNPEPYRWGAAISPPSCQPGDNCQTKTGFYQCLDACGSNVDLSLCGGLEQPGPVPETRCPCVNKDNTYREVNP